METSNPLRDQNFEKNQQIDVVKWNWYNILRLQIILIIVKNINQEQASSTARVRENWTNHVLLQI